MASSDDTSRRPHDQAFKAIFSHRRMIEDALRGYAVRPAGPLHPRTLAALDFETLERLPTEWIGDGFRRRQGDQAWRLRFRWARDWAASGGCLLILAEFQSRPDPDMALRMAGYVLGLQRELSAAGVMRPGGPLPPVFPLVVYNGPRRWTAPTELSSLAWPELGAGAPEDIADARQASGDLAAFQLRHAYFVLDFESCRGDDPRPGNAMSALICMEGARNEAELVGWLKALASLADRGLARTILEWALRRLGITGAKAEEMRAMASLDEFHSQLEERVKGWTEKWLEQGRAEGVEQGRAQGVEQGLAQGMEQGLAAQRAALRRQAALRFGPRAEVLHPLLERVDSPARLADVGEWLMVDTLEQLVAKVEAMLAEAHQR